MRRTIMLAAAATLAWQAAAQTTTMEVPQGSGNYATIGQIECLEEEGSGRYCAATWECADGTSGDLWRDMENHNGRRTIVPDHPIANRRGCTVEVDGKAGAKWFHGFRPAGRDGNVVGLANAMDALRPVYKSPETTAPPTAPSGSMLEFILERHNTTLREVFEFLCPVTRQASSDLYDRQSCQQGIGGRPGDFMPLAHVALTMASAPATPYRQCMVESTEDQYCDADNGWSNGVRTTERGVHPHDCHNGGVNAAALHFHGYQFSFEAVGGGFFHDLTIAEGIREAGHDSDYSECWPLAVREIEQLGLEVVVITRNFGGWEVIADPTQPGSVEIRMAEDDED